MKKIFALGMIFLSSVAFAGTPYMGARLSETETTISVDGYGNIATDDTTTGFGLFGGYNFNSIFATEISWDYLGKKDNVEGSSFGAWVVATPTLMTIKSIDVKPIARIGVTNTQLRESFIELNDVGLAYGLGMGIGINKTVDMFVEWTRRELNDQLLGVGIDSQFDTYSIGTRFNF